MDANKKYEEAMMEQVRDELSNMLKNYNGQEKIKLNVQRDYLEKILFVERSGKRILMMPIELLKKIDLHGVSFDYVEIGGMDFTGLEGVTINPQTIPMGIYQENNSLHSVKKFFARKKWNGDCIVKHDLSNCNFNGVTFTGSFDDSLIINSSFKGSVNAIINPQTLKAKVNIYGNSYINQDIDIRLPLIGCDFNGVTFTGNFDDVTIQNCSFNGSSGAIIELQKLHKIEIDNYEVISVLNCDFSDAEVIGPWYNVVGVSADMYNSLICSDKVKIKKK